MKFGLFVPNIGSFADAHRLLEVARAAERNGWDGFFIWDVLTATLAGEEPPLVVDPFVVLAALAVVTERIAIGTMITPVARRRPQKLARETVTLDQLSQGRLILGVGLGDTPLAEFGTFGESTDSRERARKLDEGLEVLTKLWTGEAVTFQGEHFSVRDATFLPRPVQRPRIPIWVGGHWPRERPAMRAARWDGMFPLGASILTPADYRDIREYISRHRTSAAPLDLALGARSGRPAPDGETVGEYAESGVTWWLDMFQPGDGIDAAAARASSSPWSDPTQ
jgi:alkanesulfonate monooxygenase SsuD/methylene tetrahydromethanopterin reductase-like flavin-dependent oxidoreductase (luciferase family)